MSLLNKIKERYSLNKISNFYKDKREYYNSVLNDKKLLGEKLRKVDWDEFKYSILGQLLPNAALIGAIGYSLISKEVWPAAICGAAEAARTISNESFRFEKMDFESEQCVISLDKLIDTLDEQIENSS